MKAVLKDIAVILMVAAGAAGFVTVVTSGLMCVFKSIGCI